MLLSRLGGPGATQRRTRRSQSFAHALVRDGVYASLTGTRRRLLHGAAARVLADEPTLRAEHLDLASDAEAARAYLAASKDRDALFRQDRRSRLRAADWPSQPIRRPVSTSPFRLAISSFTPAGGGKRSKPIAARFPIAAPKETACAR